LTPPQPTGSPCSRATRNSPCEAQRADAGQQALRGIEAALEEVTQLGGVGPQTVCGVGVVGVEHRQGDERGGQQPLDLRHGGGRPVPPGGVERGEERGGERVTAVVEEGALPPARVRQTDRADPPVAGVGLGHDEAVALQGPQQPAHVAGVEAEPVPHAADVVRGPVADLPQQPRLAVGTRAAQVVLVQHAQALGDRPVEAPYLFDLNRVHCLTLVKERRPRR
jgi:hypothetical protein